MVDSDTETDPLEIQPIRPVVFGEVLYDCFEEREVPGGAPLNVAWHLHALGWNPLVISRVGEDDAGRNMIKRMRDWGMDTAGIQRDMQHQTGRVEIAMEGKSHTFHILPDQAYDFIDPEAARCAVNPRHCGVLYHGSLALRGQSRHALARLNEAVEAPVFLDINLREPWWSKDHVLDMIGHASILKLNDDELELLVPDSLKGLPLKEAAQKVRAEWELDALWLTMGKQGAMYTSRDVDEMVVPIDDLGAPVVDTVGAGDAFSAGILSGFLKGATPEQTGRCATRLATRICGQQGATVADKSIYQGLEAVTNDS